MISKETNKDLQEFHLSSLENKKKRKEELEKILETIGNESDENIELNQSHEKDSDRKSNYISNQDYLYEL